MARTAFIAAPRVGFVNGTMDSIRNCRTNLIDREANGHSYAGEQAFRLPRRFCGSCLAAWNKRWRMARGLR